MILNITQANVSQVVSERSSSFHKTSNSKKQSLNQTRTKSKETILSTKRSNRKLTTMSICFASLSIISNISSLVIATQS